MSQTVTVGGVQFTAGPVGQATADAVLQDPLAQRVVWRDVYDWNGRDGTGKALVPLNSSGAAPLPNAMVFFVPRVQPNGALIRNDAASERMAQRFLDHVGAGSMRELVKAMSDLVQLPHKTLPLERFADLNSVASYRIRMHTGYVVVQLRHLAEDLTAYLCIPSRVSFHHEVTAILDEEGYRSLLEAAPGLRDTVVDFVVPSRSKPNAGLRRLAIAKRIEDERAALAQVTSDVSSVTLSMLRERVARSEAEWDALKAG